MTPSADKDVVEMEPWAVGIGLGTLVLVLGMAIFTAWDRMHTPSLETVITPTAVGDMHFVPEPARGVTEIGLKYQGHQLTIVSETKLRDATLIRVGTDDSGIYTLYQLEDEQGRRDAQLFMKVGLNEFIKVTAE